MCVATYAKITPTTKWKIFFDAKLDWKIAGEIATAVKVVDIAFLQTLLALQCQGHGHYGQTDIATRHQQSHHTKLREYIFETKFILCAAPHVRIKRYSHLIRVCIIIIIIMKDKSRWCQFYGLLSKDCMSVLGTLLFSASPFFLVLLRFGELLHDIGVECTMDIAALRVSCTLYP